MSLAIENRIKQLITVPQYFSQYINPTVNLEDTNKICCPFHDEDTPSFSYDPINATWRCFGSCKKGGDVIAMHQAKHKMYSRREALESLAITLNIRIDEIDFTVYDNIKVDENEVKLAVLLQKAESVCKNIDDWVSLDILMSYHKPKNELVEDLDEFILHRTVN